jgi:hypothetical protein
MPTIPLPEVDEQADLRATIVRTINTVAGVDRKVSLRAIITLVVVTACAVFNPEPVVAVTGGIAGVLLALEVARK